jgi:hypothetical protein
MICFWYKLVASENKLSGKLYQLLLTSSGSNKFKWINYVKSILDDTGFSNISLYQKHIILIFLCNSERNLLSSPYTIKLGVEDLTDRILLQNCK